MNPIFNQFNNYVENDKLSPKIAYNKLLKIYHPDKCVVEDFAREFVKFPREKICHKITQYLLRNKKSFLDNKISREIPKKRSMFGPSSKKQTNSFTQNGSKKPENKVKLGSRISKFARICFGLEDFAKMTTQTSFDPKTTQIYDISPAEIYKFQRDSMDYISNYVIDTTKDPYNQYLKLKSDINYLVSKYYPQISQTYKTNKIISAKDNNILYDITYLMYEIETCLGELILDCFEATYHSINWEILDDLNSNRLFFSS